MSAWILSITGIVVLGVLADVLLPEGQTNKYIKGIFGILTLLAIISPLPRLLNFEFGAESLYNFDADIVPDENFSESVRGVYAAERRAESYVKSLGVTGAEIYVAYDAKNPSKIDYVNIYLSNAEFNGAPLNSDIVVKIESGVSELLSINADRVRILYG
jgi:Stage III sporulation protein AF (Spore_III_AF).